MTSSQKAIGDVDPTVFEACIFEEAIEILQRLEKLEERKR